jgi:hypothetical protein
LFNKKHVDFMKVVRESRRDYKISKRDTVKDKVVC